MIDYLLYFVIFLSILLFFLIKPWFGNIPNSTHPYLIFSSSLSPFGLKIKAMFLYAGLPFRFGFGDSFFSQLSNMLRCELLTRFRILKLHIPKEMSSMDEFPMVPFVFGADGTNMYDSTAIGHWIHTHNAPLLPSQPHFEFLATFLDDFFDEWVLYLVHQQRWTNKGNNRQGKSAGTVLSQEFMLPQYLQKKIAELFNARQTRRLAYLFSVSPIGTKSQQDYLPLPPIDSSFATHELLEDSFKRLLDSLEQIFSKHAFILTDSFSLVDAACYGMIGMNVLIDEGSAEYIRKITPRTYAWVRKIQEGNLPSLTKDLKVHKELNHLRGLIEEVCATYVPLMQQMNDAYEKSCSQGNRLFNERGFDRGNGMFEGVIRGTKFRTVIKTFQVKGWRNILKKWEELSKENQKEILYLFPKGFSF